MNVQELRYFAALADHRHFGRAAKACNVSQPTLSGQLRKLEEHLGVTLFERTNKWVALTPIGERILEHAKKVLDSVNQVEAVARASQDQMAGPLRFGVIPTLAPYLMPLIFGPLREAHPGMTVELWEDVTLSLLDLLRSQRLDAALIATEVSPGDLTTTTLFVEPFLAALHPAHRLANADAVHERDLARDILVLSEGHCLAAHTLTACGRKSVSRGGFQAASLDTLVNLVAAGYGSTLIPGLAAGALGQRNVVLRPLIGGASRTIRLASRPSFPRPLALKALEKIIRQVMSPEHAVRLMLLEGDVSFQAGAACHVAGSPIGPNRNVDSKQGHTTAPAHDCGWRPEPPMRSEEVERQIMNPARQQHKGIPQTTAGRRRVY